MPTQEEVIDQLKKVFDPEIPVNVWDLGLIYNIQIDENRIGIKMSLTSAACPAAKQLPDLVRSRVSTIPNVSDVQVEVVWEPKWEPALISEEGRKILKLDS